MWRPVPGLLWRDPPFYLNYGVNVLLIARHGSTFFSKKTPRIIGGLRKPLFGVFQIVRTILANVSPSLLPPEVTTAP